MWRPACKEAGNRSGAAEDVSTYLRDIPSSGIPTMTIPGKVYSDFYDVTFRCSDGIGVRGPRYFLASRCAVFKGMFTNGMLETGAAEIPLPMFTSRAINAVLEVLFTGRITFHDPNKWEMGLEVLSAATFFMIPEAESIAQKDLQTHMGIIRPFVNKSTAMKFLTAAVEFPEVEASGGSDDLLGQLVESIGPDWFQLDHAHDLSRKAVECILARSQHVSCEDEG